MVEVTPHQDEIEKIKNVILGFVNSESFGGILLFFSALVAMVLANSPLSELYFELWEIQLGVIFHEVFVGMSLHYWINDVLMALFFLMVGLEIKRELLYGELSEVKKAAFPAFAALGGMVVPAGLFLALNYGTPSQGGFGIPMATDIAFALGVLMLLGSRISLAFKVFLVSLAIVDDMGAVMMIAIFYTHELSANYLLLSLGVVALLLLLNRLGVRSLFPYLVLGVVLWIFVHSSGVHATIAAVILAFLIPVRSKINRSEFRKKIAIALEGLKYHDSDLLEHKEVHSLDAVTEHALEVQNPLIRLEHALHPICAYCVMPIFAFANAGVSLAGEIDFGIDALAPGIALGLLVGKPLGIVLFTFLADRLKLATKPSNMSWMDVGLAGMLAGIGFTMSIFITSLAFEETQMVALSKITILSSSVVAALLGVIGILMRPKKPIIN